MANINILYKAIATALIVYVVYVIYKQMNCKFTNVSSRRMNPPPQRDQFQWDRNSGSDKANGTFRTMEQSWSKFGPSTSPDSKPELNQLCLTDNVEFCQMSNGKTGTCTTYGFCMPLNM